MKPFLSVFVLSMLLLGGCSLPSDEKVNAQITFVVTVLHKDTGQPVVDSTYMLSSEKLRDGKQTGSVPSVSAYTDVYGRAYYHFGYNLHEGEVARMCIFLPGPGNQCEQVTYAEANAASKTNPETGQRTASITKSFTVYTDFT